MSPAPPIVILRQRIVPGELARLVAQPFGDMVKFVADLDRRVLAIGGELHSDAEQLLLEQGSRQDSLWGANYYPGRGEGECIEFRSLINIRPSQGNRSQLVSDPARREQIQRLAFELIGRGEPLA